MSFWLIAGAGVLAVLACVVPPLWRGAAGRAPRAAVLLLAIALPLSTLALYRTLGAPAILDVQPALQGTSHDAEAMVRALEARLKAQPDDAEGWHLLGRAYVEWRRIGEAETALARAVALAPRNARYLAYLAEAHALADDGDFGKRARPLIAQALELDPQDEKTLELAGLAAFQREEWALAAYYWRALQKRLPPGSEYYDDIEAALSQARGKAEQASGLGDRARLEPPPRATMPGAAR